MKKSLAIVLIAILLLNVMGYYGIFLGMQYCNDRSMTRLLDAGGYDQQQSIMLKIPVSIPYMADQNEFVRSTDKFEHEGRLYRVVKQRYARDTLTIICVKDIEHEKINTMLADYVKSFTDSPSDKSTGTQISISFIKDYLPESFFLRTTCNGWSTKIILNTNNGTLVPSFTASIIHPPERTQRKL